MFDPNANDTITISDIRWRFTEHPALPDSGIPYAQEGRAGTVYQLLGQHGNLAALKVFKPDHRDPSLSGQAGALNRYAGLQGLRACHRAVLTPEWHKSLIAQSPELSYAALMDWVPGRSWFDIVQSREPLTPEQSQALAAAFMGVLVQMEQAGVAHGDLSGANLLIDGLDGGDLRVELVDVEQLYAPDMQQPARIPAGSPGYAHATMVEHPWRADMDRFAGAVLLAEILGWCDERVCEAAEGDSFFAEDELQQDCERYRLLRGVLAERWGEGAAVLLDGAWHSEKLSDCPPFIAERWGLPLPPELPPLPPPVVLTESPQLRRISDDEQSRIVVPPPPPPDPPWWRRPVFILPILLLIGAIALMLFWPPGGGEVAPLPTVSVPSGESVVVTAATTAAPVPTDTPSVSATDSDGDGLPDIQEIQNYNTDPNNPDSDDDGLSDGQEVQNYNTDPNNPDSDGDGLTDGDEILTYNTDPNNPDSDNDGLSDGQEVHTYKTDPNNADSDGDGLSDYDEIHVYGTDPNKADSDGDGLTDYEEVKIYRTDPGKRDSDEDGLSDYDEVNLYDTDPNNPDMDNDGLSDGYEIKHGEDPFKFGTGEQGPTISSLRLVNASTGRNVGQIKDGDNISLRQSGCGASGACYLNVEAVPGNNVTSVTFKLDGQSFEMNGRALENTAPYYMAGDVNNKPQGNWNWANLVGGRHTIEAQACDQVNAQGTCGPPLAASFTVTR